MTTDFTNNYALVENGVVVNLILWDGVAEFDPSPAIAVKVNTPISLGWLYDGKKFIAPPTAPVNESVIIRSNETQRTNLMNEATRWIAVLTDAIDPDIMGDDINPEDEALLKLWKAYRVKLSRLTDMLNPEWPDKPNA